MCCVSGKEISERRSSHENLLEKVWLSVALKMGRTLNESNFKDWSFRKE